MAKLQLHHYIFTAVLAAAFPLCGYGRTSEVPVMAAAVTDTSVTPQQTPKPSSVEKTTETKQEVKVPDIIKEVPKSRRKVKPIAVPAPIPVKPLKVIKPKVIKIGI
ncbi:hypothetical protein [uncultured Chitinophaga sp.]|uniref:hypothetical protein n=1 Tax=uncultured Chitinophaga sp. TaxID=339340 RepID=UPI0025EC117E|nr:hypothetical protein [uncultured Chitinophaga sp.]